MIRHLSLMLLKRDGKLLLGLKKRGFGMGKLNGTGGKVEPNESYEAGAIRETLEEVGIRVNNCTKVGQIIFKDLYFKGAPETDIMHVYLSEDFSGEAVETDEIKPQWYSLDKLPYDQMWSDDEYWLPQVLDGKKIDAFFHFNEQNVFTTYQVNIVPDKLIAEFSDSIFGLPEDGDKTKFVTRTAARAVLLDQNNRVALINAKNRGYYKLPGGGIEEDELIEEALNREVLEEAGYTIEGLQELGYTHETRHKFEQLNISYAFLTHTKDFLGSKLEEDEKEDGFELQWFEDIDAAIAAIESVDTSDMVYQAKFFTMREIAILKAARDVMKAQNG